MIGGTELPLLVLRWAHKTFGDIALRRDERAMRFVEEAIELVHAEGLPADTVRKIIDRVYARPAGDVRKEIGQAQLTLDCLAQNIGIGTYPESLREWERIKAIPKEEWDRRHSAKVALGIAN